MQCEIERRREKHAFVEGEATKNPAYPNPMQMWWREVEPTTK